jgi:hypothetical protein
LVLVWVKAPPRQGAGACGAFTPWQEEQATEDMPPLKSFPWHDWQEKKPWACALAWAPWDDGADHPAGCPVSGLNVDSLLPLLLLHPASAASTANRTTSTTLPDVPHRPICMSSPFLTGCRLLSDVLTALSGIENRQELLHGNLPPANLSIPNYYLR